MRNAPRNDEGLIGQKLNRPTFEVDDELSTQHEEELIVVVVFVPVVFALHHTKAHHRVVYPAERLVVPLVRDGLGQRRHVDELQGIELDVEVCCVRVGCFSHGLMLLRCSWICFGRGARMQRRNRDLITSLAARHRVPAVYPFRYFATAAGPPSYPIHLTSPLPPTPAPVPTLLPGPTTPPRTPPPPPASSL